MFGGRRSKSLGVRPRMNSGSFNWAREGGKCAKQASEPVLSPPEEMKMRQVRDFGRHFICSGFNLVSSIGSVNLVMESGMLAKKSRTTGPSEGIAESCQETFKATKRGNRRIFVIHAFHGTIWYVIVRSNRVKVTGR